MTTAATLVVGFGNTLALDDGVGPEVVRQLVDGPLPEGARVVQARGDALELADLWRGEPRVWLVDAVIRGAAPGTLHLLEHEEVLAFPQRHGTVHHLSLPECLRWLALALPATAGVRYRLFGVEPASVGVGEGLTPAVAAAATRLSRRLRDELRYLPG